MSYTHEVRAEERYALVVGRGTTDTTESVAALYAVLSDPGFKPGFGLLIDLRELTTVPSPKQAHEFSRVLTKAIPSQVSRMALVMGGMAAFGMGRLLSTVMTSQTNAPIEVFQDLAPATAWVAQPPSSPGI